MFKLPIVVDRIAGLPKMTYPHAPRLFVNIFSVIVQPNPTKFSVDIVR